MLDLALIDNEIEALEDGETTYETCERLACLYTVRDHLKARAGGESEFLEATASAPIPDVLQVIDEHLSAVRILYPKEYEAVIERIRGL